MGISFVVGAIISDFIVPAVINYAIGQIASSFIQSAFGSTPQQDQSATQNYSAKAQGRQQIIRSAVANRNVIYGETKISGPLVYASTTGGDNAKLHMIIALAAHEVESIGDIYFNDEPIFDGYTDSNGVVYKGRFAEKARIERFYGRPGQAACATLMAEDPNWTAAHRGEGIAYLYVQLTWDQDVYATGIPNVSAVVRGKRVYDPRNGLTRYSTNWALCFRDFLTSTVYGLGCEEDELHPATFIAAANISDERCAGPVYVASFTSADPNTGLFTLSRAEANLGTGDGVVLAGSPPAGLSAGVTYYYIMVGSQNFALASTPQDAMRGRGYALAFASSGSGTITFVDQVRYTVNGVVDTGTKPLDTIKQMVSAGGGDIVYTQGVWKLYAGAYRAPAGSIGTADLAGDIDVMPTVDRKSLFNGVRGTFVSPANVWQPADFPPVKSATYAGYDGGEILTDVDWPFINNGIAAQRLAKLMLEKHRQSVNVNFPAKYTVFKYDVIDTLMASVAQLGWAGKEFTIRNWKFSATGGVNLVLQEESPAVYQWGPGDAQAIYAAPPSNLPNPYNIPVPGTPDVREELYETTGSAGVKARAVVGWGASASAFVVAYEAQYKAHNDEAWLPLPPISLLVAHKDDLAPGLYDFRVRAVTGLGVRSGFSAIVTKELQGLVAEPMPVTGFSVVASGGSALVTYDAHPDLDVRIGGKIVVRWTPDVPPAATWANTVIYEEFAGNSVSGQLPLKSGTYFAKAKDSTGHFSATAASFVVTQGMLADPSVIATITEHPGFTGAKVNVALVGGGIQLDGSSTIDGMTGDIDSWGYIDTMGGVSSSGTYTFAGSFDGGTVATRRFESVIRVAQFDTGDLIDSRTDLIDDWGLFDGNLIEDCDLVLEARITNDDPSGSPAWGGWTPFYVAEFNCRAAQFRARLLSGGITHNINANQLQVLVKV